MQGFLFPHNIHINKRLALILACVIVLLLAPVVALLLITHHNALHMAGPSRPSDGQGVYEYCAPLRGQPCLDRLQRIAAGGFKLVVNYEQLKGNEAQELAYADKAQAVGVKIIWALDNPVFWNDSDLKTYYPTLATTCSCENNANFIRYFVNLVKHHPATWGYYIGDEVEPVHHAALKEFSQLVHETDPVHPRLFVTYNVKKLAVFADSADVIAEDYYPIGTPDESVGGTSRVARDVQTLADQQHIATAMVLQAHSLGEYPAYANLCTPFPDCMPYPSVSQMRQMRDQVLQNAQPRLLLWYSYFDMLKADDPTQRWSNLINAAKLS